MFIVFKRDGRWNWEEIEDKNWVGGMNHNNFKELPNFRSTGKLLNWMATKQALPFVPNNQTYDFIVLRLMKSQPWSDPKAVLNLE